MPERHAGNDLIDTSYASYARAWLVCLQALSLLFNLPRCVLGSLLIL